MCRVQYGVRFVSFCNSEKKTAYKFWDHLFTNCFRKKKVAESKLKKVIYSLTCLFWMLFWLYACILCACVISVTRCGQDKSNFSVNWSLFALWWSSTYCWLWLGDGGRSDRVRENNHLECVQVYVLTTGLFYCSVLFDVVPLVLQTDYLLWFFLLWFVILVMLFICLLCLWCVCVCMCCRCLLSIAILECVRNLTYSTQSWPCDRWERN